jgi:hypothetical protein
MAFAQGTVTDRQPMNSAAQPNGNSVNTSPNSNGTVPGSTQGKASRTLSAPNQSLPGDANPANASAGEGKANGRATRGGQPDNSGNNGISTDGTGNNPASGRDVQNTTNPGTGENSKWFWVAFGLVLALLVIRLLAGRNRVRGNVYQNDAALRSTNVRQTTNRSDAERERDRIRRVS